LSAKFHSRATRIACREQKPPQNLRIGHRQRDPRASSLAGDEAEREAEVARCSMHRRDYLAPLTSAEPPLPAYVPYAFGGTSRHEWSSQSRLRISPRGGAGEVNSWPTSERELLHSRQYELPFEISIFYAYTWETCGRPPHAAGGVAVAACVCARTRTRGAFATGAGRKRELSPGTSTSRLPVHILPPRRDRTTAPYDRSRRHSDARPLWGSARSYLARLARLLPAAP